MTVTYTVDVFSSLDGFGTTSGNWGGYWGSRVPSCSRTAWPSTARSSAWSSEPARTGCSPRCSPRAPRRPRSGRLGHPDEEPPGHGGVEHAGRPLDWPDATVVPGDAVDVVARLKEESDVPLRSHGSLSLNRALMAAGLVDLVQVTIFPVITGQTGTEPVFQGAADFDLELVRSRTLDGRSQELIYRPTLHG
ncbi:dihydrofolate reductase family protein [Micromonospora sp. M12]